MHRRHGFTLIELLAVIAIIALLSAIIFPVFARARDNANRSSDLSSLNSIRSALQLYKVDNGGYPPALLGYVNPYEAGAIGAGVVPADRITGFLYPKRVGGINSFKSVVSRYALDATTKAVWPQQDARAVGSAPQVDLNGDGAVNGADDIAGARQAYGPTTQVLQDPSQAASATNQALNFYQISGYDVAQLPKGIGAASERWEVRYRLFWSNYSIGQGAGYGQGNALDDPRQLGYSDPDDKSVITWNSYYRDWEPQGVNKVPQRSKRDMVLFLGGAARMFDSRQVYDQGWRVLP